MNILFNPQFKMFWILFVLQGTGSEETHLPAHRSVRPLRPWRLFLGDAQEAEILNPGFCWLTHVSSCLDEPVSFSCLLPPLFPALPHTQTRCDGASTTLNLRSTEDHPGKAAAFGELQGWVVLPILHDSLFPFSSVFWHLSASYRVGGSKASIKSFAWFQHNPEYFSLEKRVSANP